jgi:hypothetical protein
MGWCMGVVYGCMSVCVYGCLGMGGSTGKRVSRYGCIVDRCGCVGTWVYGVVLGVWAYGCVGVGVPVHARVSGWVYGYMGAWMCGSQLELGLGLGVWVYSG